MPDTHLKIAIVALDFNREGGSERRTAQLIERLAARGHAVHLIGARIAGAQDPRIVCHPIPTRPRPHWSEIVQFTRQARVVAARESFDLVHNQIRPFVPGVLTVGGGCHRFYLREILPKERGEVCAWLKRHAPLHWVLLALERRGFDPIFCPVVLTNSALARDGILKYYSYPADRIVVAHNGVDAERFRPAEGAAGREALRQRLGIGPTELLVLFMGSGFARKGLRPLLAAAARASARGATLRLVVAGSGAPEAWRRQAKRLGLAARVQFVGAVPDPEVYYRAADVFALPTYFDPFANATLEAMASGLPVVTTRLNGVSEILRPGHDGLLIDRPEDIQGLTDALLTLQDPGYRRDMGLRARETALRYPWDGPLQATLAVYERVLAERGATGGGAEGHGGRGAGERRGGRNEKPTMKN